MIATGTTAAVPAVLAGVNPWTSREATSAHAVPGRLAIVGGGVVGCEMATAWSALCSEVTLVTPGRLLDRLPGFAGDLVAAGLRDAGVDVRLGVGVTEAKRPDTGAGGGSGHGGPVTLVLDDGTSVEADEILAATGRSPHTGDIGLEIAGLSPGSWLDVDDTMRVPAVEGGWLYAAGDVNHLALLTHMGKYQARICGDAIAARAAGREPTLRDLSSKTCIPQVIFTIPEVAAVGLTADQAEKAGRRIRTVEYDIGQVAGAGAVRRRLPGPRPDDRRRGPPNRSRSHPGRPRRRRDYPLRDHRRSGRSPPGQLCGTPSPATPPSAKSGSASSRPTASKRPTAAATCRPRGFFVGVPHGQSTANETSTRQYAYKVNGRDWWDAVTHANDTARGANGVADSPRAYTVARGSTWAS